MRKRYRNIVFDVGGVLLGYRVREMMTQDYGLTKEEWESFSHCVFDSPLWQELDYETISMEQVMERYVEQSPEQEAVLRWFFTHTERMHVARPEVWKRARMLKEAGCRLYILSNYNSDMFRIHTEIIDFMSLLDGKVVSCEIHRLKPEAVIYETLFSRYGLDPAECLFFDDRPENVEGSKACGMDAIRVTSEEQLCRELDDLLMEMKNAE